MIAPMNERTNGVRHYKLFGYLLIPILLFVGLLLPAFAVDDVVIQDDGPGFTRYGNSNYWWVWTGYGTDGRMLQTFTNGKSVDNQGEWKPNLSVEGDYEVYVYIPRNYADTTDAHYEIYGANGQTEKIVNQSSYFDAWVSLGTYHFNAGSPGYLRLTDYSDIWPNADHNHGGKWIGFDAAKWVYRGGTPTPPVIPTPGIAVSNAHMISSHQMQVHVDWSFSGDSWTTREVDVDFDLPGEPNHIHSTISPTTQGGTDLVYDFQQLNIPKFQGDADFNIVASANESGSKNSSTEHVRIRIPLIMVPGIDATDADATGGDGTFPEAESFFTANGFELTLPWPYFSASLYPTLYTLSYWRNDDTLVDASLDLAQLINTALANTYSAKVNIVAHSKGTLVARWYLCFEGGASKVRWLHMVQGPHSGSLWARLGNNVGYDYRNLFPLWPSNHSKANTPYIYVPTTSKELPTLSTTPMPIAPSYTLYYSQNWETPYVSTLGVLSGTIGGDGIVPWFSQLGYNCDPNSKPLTPVLLSAFKVSNLKLGQVEIYSSHLTSMKDQQVLQYVLGSL